VYHDLFLFADGTVKFLDSGEVEVEYTAKMKKQNSGSLY
jgi:hypothetical protein